MEDSQTAAGTQDNFIIMQSVDQRSHSKGRSDLLTRRLKNRDRQRRYRARKRLEAETKKSFVVENTAAVQVQVELQPNGNHNNFLRRIYCTRDWKKDARRAHLPKHQEVNGSIVPSPIVTGVPEVTCLAIGNKSETMPEREIPSGSFDVVNNETPRVVLGRRDWKAEARKKKN